MPSLISVVFWGSILVTAYTYAGYPLAIAVLSKLIPRRPGGPCHRPESVSIVIAARNEGIRIEERVCELQRQLEIAQVDGEIILVLDGHQDSVPQFPSDPGRPPVVVIRLRERVGKAAAVSAGVEHANGQIVALADVRQRWADDALDRLLNCFKNSEVGAVSGDLILESTLANQGVGFYWRYEKWIRRNESDFDSLVGVSGAIAAVRRPLFQPIPQGTLLDDIYWPLKVVMTGSRVVHDASAIAYDRLPTEAADEFRRKVRTLAGNYQLLARLPSAFVPWKNRAWVQLISHKMLRLVVPWALIAAFFAPLFMSGFVYAWAFRLEMFVLGVLAVGSLCGESLRPRWVSAGMSFAMLNFAAWIAFWVWISGSSTRSWRAVKYSTDT